MRASTSTPRHPDDLPEGFDEAFARETNELLVARLRLGLTVGLVLYLLFGVLDYAWVPSLWREFLAVRLGVAALSAATLALIQTEFGLRHVRGISVAIMYAGTFGISLMTALWTGFDNVYFVGNMLALFLVGLYFPWGARITALYSALTVVTYLLLNLTLHPSQDLFLAAPPLFFLIGTGVLTTWAAAAGERWRRHSLEMRMQLAEANEELKSLDEAKTSFFANVSHELRTPLMLILGPLDELLREHRGSDEERALLQAMNTNAHRLLRQVNLILNFSKIEAGRMEISAEIGDLGGMVRRLAEAARPYATQREIELVVEGLETIPSFAFDQEKLETVASNLLSNAMKFTPDGGRITVRGGVEGSTAWFEVEDTGCGIPEKDVDKVFERFHQVDGGKNGKVQGTGLGLALSKEFVELHGGNMSVRSTYGEGTTFRVEVPMPEAAMLEQAGVAPAVQPPAEPDAAASSDDAAPTDSGEAAAAAKVTRHRASGATEFADLARPSLEDERPTTQQAPDDAPLLLVVEDNPDMRAFVSSSLAKRYRVETAANGRLGLEKARRIRPDLIVSDVMMPEMDGFEMVEALRKDKTFAGTPIIFLTARTGSESVVKGLTLGAVDYVNKPFKLEELMARIDAQLRLLGAERALVERDSRLMAVGQMTGTIAHDLRSPLTAALGRLEILRMVLAAGKTDKAEGEIATIERVIHRIEEMVQELLEFVRGHDLKLACEPTNVPDFVTECADDLRPALEAVGIELEVKRHGDPEATLAMDRMRMQRVIENLVNNSRDALLQQGDGDQDDKRIRLVVAADAREVRITVSDNGPGIPDEVADRLFEAFATAGKANGTGLGLMIVKNLVSAHHGKVSVEARGEDGGASFTLTFPLGKATGDVTPQAITATASSRRRTDNDGSRRDES